jgi:predicted dehydrogenase
VRKLRGALVGYGFIAEKGHLPAYSLQNDLEIVAVADVCEARRDRAARALPRARIFSSHAALLSEMRGELDFVDICVPPSAHAEIALAALDAGLHVLCEKPLATTVPEARAMLSKAGESKRVLFPSHNYQHAPVVKAVRRILDEGTLGKIHLVTLDTFRSTHARGVSEWNEHWRREPRYSGGGIGMDHGSHTFYLAFEWLRSYPTAISAAVSSRHGGVEDTMAAHVTFPTGTAIATLTWTAGVRKVIYTLHGEHGAIRVEDDAIEISTMKSAAGGPARWDVTRRAVPSDWMDASHVGWFVSLIDRFRLAIDTRDYVGRDAEDAFRCIDLITAAYRSGRAGGREVRLDSREVRLDEAS